MHPRQERGVVQRPARLPCLLHPSSTSCLLPSEKFATCPKLDRRIVQRLDQMSAQFEPPGRGRSAQVDAGTSASSHETTRRLITGHDENGKAIFLSDEVLKTTSPYSEDMSPPEGTIPGFTLIHRAEGFPTTSVNGPVTEWHGKRIPLSNTGSTVCRVVDFPPIGEDGDAFMHRTQSVDFGVVLKGSIKLILDDGLEKTMSEGDVVVQRLAYHPPV